VSTSSVLQQFKIEFPLFMVAGCKAVCHVASHALVEVEFAVVTARTCRG
jgi:hypothetical protein